MFIDDRFFVAGRTEVAGINTKSGGISTERAQELQNEINDWVAEKEPIFLRAMLGDHIMRKMHHDDKLKKKVRDILVDDMRSRSPIAYYVYFFYERNRASFTTVAGERTKKTDNSIAVSPIYKLVLLWNDMVDWNNRIVQAFEDAEIPIEPDFDDDIFSKINSFNI